MPSVLIVAGEPPGSQSRTSVTYLTFAELHTIVHSPLAKCRDMDPATFHPEPAPGKRLVSSQYLEVQAQLLCAGCPIERECLEYALRREASATNCFGIWGATAPAQRKAILLQRRREAVA
jgi:hypothetical protein